MEDNDEHAGYLAGAGTEAHGAWTALDDGGRLAAGGAGALRLPALDVKFSDSARLVKLRSGEAFFTVKSGDARPFTVKAGGVSIVVTGTAFNVGLADEAVSVAVETGSVEARMPPVETARGTMEPVLRQLAAGEQLVARADGTIEQGPVNPAEAGAWRRHRLHVDGATVGETIAHLRRYGRVAAHGGRAVRRSGASDLGGDHRLAALIDSLPRLEKNLQATA